MNIMKGTTFIKVSDGNNSNSRQLCSFRPRVSNHPGRDQLSQVGSQMNIIASKNTLLYY